VQSLRQRLQREIDRQVPFSVKGLAVDGHDLQQLGISPGPHMGQLLQRLLHRVLDDPSQNTRDALLTLAQQEMDAES
jgi:tRNA nucleotidyltransferase (CCA-adding enzyme)